MKQKIRDSKIFVRGSFQFAYLWILFSPAFTSLFKEKVGVYFGLLVLSLVVNSVIEWGAKKVRGTAPKRYLPVFLVVALPVNLLILYNFIHK